MRARERNSLGPAASDGSRSEQNCLRVPLQRPCPPLTNLFFKEFSKSIFSITGFVSKNQPKKDINKLLKNTLPSSIQSKSFYNIWLEDMSNICKLFCTFLNANKLSFWLGNIRGCKRYHVDMVPFRLLVTYEGQGTEILPNYAANRDAFVEGKPNNKIIKDKSARKFINIKIAVRKINAPCARG